MESDAEIRASLKVADRAAAAPYVDYPADPWWAVPGFGVLAALLVLGIDLRGRDDVAGWVGMSVMALVVLLSIGYLRWQLRRRGVVPSGSAPPEVARVYRGYFIGAALVAVAVLTLAWTTPLLVAAPCAFVITAAGMTWFGRSYDAAAAAVRERLA